MAEAVGKLGHHRGEDPTRPVAFVIAGLAAPQLALALAWCGWTPILLPIEGLKASLQGDGAAEGRASLGDSAETRGRASLGDGEGARQFGRLCANEGVEEPRRGHEQQRHSAHQRDNWRQAGIVGVQLVQTTLDLTKPAQEVKG